MKLNRRDTLILAAGAGLAGFAGIGPAMAREGDMIDVAKLMAPAGDLPEHAEGSEAAPVTVIEYASPTCPHCAEFHNTTYDAFKAAYIDTGKVRFILRPFLRNVLDAVVFMIAEAAPTQYHEIIAAYFRTQGDWAASSTPKDALFAIAQQFGFTMETFEAALTNQDLVNSMNAVREQALNEFGLEGTPTFYVNGKLLGGSKSLDQLAAEIDPLVPADFVASEPAAPAAETPAATPADAPAATPTETPADAPAETPAATPAQ